MIDLEVLIAEVQSRPPLWDVNSPHRHNREVLDALWDEIATQFAVGRDEVRKKWKGLRDTYRRELRKNMRIGTVNPNNGTGDASTTESSGSNWVFFRTLRFLKGQMKLRHTEKDEAASDEDMHEWDASTGRGTKRLLAVESAEGDADGDPTAGRRHDEDEDFHFFMSLLPHVRHLQPARKLRMRARIQDVVYRAAYCGDTGDASADAADDAAAAVAAADDAVTANVRWM